MLKNYEKINFVNHRWSNLTFQVFPTSSIIWRRRYLYIYATWSDNVFFFLQSKYIGPLPAKGMAVFSVSSLLG